MHLGCETWLSFLFNLFNLAAKYNFTIGISIQIINQHLVYSHFNPKQAFQWSCSRQFCFQFTVWTIPARICKFWFLFWRSCMKQSLLSQHKQMRIFFVCSQKIKNHLKFGKCCHTDLLQVHSWSWLDYSSHHAKYQLGFYLFVFCLRKKQANSLDILMKIKNQTVFFFPGS